MIRRERINSCRKEKFIDKIKYLEDELIIQNQKYSMLEIEYKKSEFLLEENKDSIESLQHRITVLDDENSSYKAIIHAIEEVREGNQMPQKKISWLI